MPFYDRTIDAVILTHPHLDHYAGLNEVMKKYKVNLEMDSGTKNKGAGFVEFENLIKDEKIKKALRKKWNENKFGQRLAFGYFASGCKQ